MGVFLACSAAVQARISYTESAAAQFDAGGFSNTYRAGAGSSATVRLEYAGRTAGLESPDAAAWFADPFAFRRPLTVTSPSALSDQQVLVQFNSQSEIAGGRMKADGSDIRFATSSALSPGGELPYWIESGLNTTATRAWVRMPVLAAGSSVPVYLYAGDPSASAKSSISRTFLFGDDFTAPNGTAPSTATWSPTESGSTLAGSLRDIQNNLLRLYFGGTGGTLSYGLRSTDRYSFASRRYYQVTIDANATNGDNAYSSFALCPVADISSDHADNFLKFRVQHAAAGPRYAIRRKIAGVETDLLASTPLSVGTHVINMYVDGTQAQVYLDGVLVFSGVHNLNFTNPYLYVEGTSSYASLKTFLFGSVFVAQSVPAGQADPVASAVASVQGVFVPAGTFTSQIIDTTAADSRFELARWLVLAATGSNAAVSARVHNSNIALASYTALTDGGDPGLSGRFIQYRVALDRTDARYSASFSSITLSYTSVPLAPAGFAGVVLGTASVRWEWQDPSGPQFLADGYRLFDQFNVQRTSSPFPAGTTSWIETGLSANTPLQRYLQAFNVAGSSATAMVVRYTLASVPAVTADQASGSWVPAGSTIQFTNSAGFGPGGVQYYRTVWTSSAAYPSWTGSEPLWSSGTLSFVPIVSGSYYLHLRSFNGADVATATAAVSGPYRFDAFSPSFASVIPSSGDWTNGVAAASVTVADTGGSTLSRVRYRWWDRAERPLTNWSAWDPRIAGSSSYTLWFSSAAAATVYLHLELEDGAGNLAYTYAGPYRIDRSSPVAGISIESGASYTPLRDITLSLSFADDISGVRDVSYRNVPGSWSAWEAPASTRAWTLLTGTGTRTVEYQVRDTAGNIALASDTIIVDTSTLVTADPVTTRASGVMGEAPEVFTARATLRYAPTGAVIAGETIRFVFANSTATVVSDAFGIVTATFAAPSSSGTFSLRASLPASAVYAFSSGTGTVQVSVRPSILFAQDVSANAGVSFIATAQLKDRLSAGNNPITGRAVSFVFNGSSASAVTNGVGIASASFVAPLSTNVYTYSATFAGDAVYDANSSTASVGVGIRLVSLVLSDIFTTARSSFAVQVVMQDGALPVSSRTVSIAYNGIAISTVTNALGRGSVSFVAPASSGTSIVSATFTGDEQYYATSSSATVTVTPRPVTMSAAPAASGYVNGTAVLWVRLTDGLSGEDLPGRSISFSFDGSTQSVLTDLSGVSTATFASGAAVRVSSWSATFAGDPGYEAFSTTAPVSIVRRTSEVTAFPATAFAGSTVTLQGLFTDGVSLAAVAGKTLTFQFGASHATSVTDGTGIATATFAVPSSTATYNWSVTFAQDAVYEADSATSTVTVNRRTTVLSAYPRFVYTLDAIQPVADLVDGIGGGAIAGATVTFTFNSASSSTVTTAAGRAISVFASTPVAGDYIYTAAFAGNALYAASSSSATVQVIRRPVNINAAPVSVVAGENFTASGQLSDGLTSLGLSGQTLSFVFGASTGSAITSSTGTASQVFTAPSSTDTYFYSVTFAQTESYAGGSATGTITVSRRTPSLSAVPKTAYARDSIFLSASLFDGATPLAGRSISFVFQGSTLSALTAGSGFAQAGPFAAIASSGTSSFSCSFAGDALYNARTATAAVTIQQRPVTVSAYPATAILVSSVTLRADLMDGLTGLPVSTKTLAFILQGNATPVTAVTSSTGMASALFSVPGSSATYSFSVSFNGDAAYAFGSDTGTLTVQLRPTQLAASDVSSPAGSTITVSATLRDQTSGAVLAGRQVVFLYKGASSATVTSASGYAAVSYFGGASSGTFSFSATFPGTTVYGSSSATGTVSMGRRTTAVLTADSFAVALDTFTLSARLLDDALGTGVAGSTLSFTFSGATFTLSGITNSSGTARVIYTAPGSTGPYTFSATFNGTPLYLPSSGASQVTIQRRTVQIRTFDQTGIPALSTFTATAELSDARTGATISTQTMTFTFLASSGSAVTGPAGVAGVVFAAPASTGTKQFVAAFAGSALYEPWSEPGSIQVVPRPTVLETYNDIEAVVGLPFQPRARLMDYLTGAVIAGRSVSIHFGTYSLSGMTDAFGIAQSTFTAPASSGPYVYSALFSGDALYALSQSTGMVTVRLRPTTFILNNIETLAMSTFTVTASLIDTLTNDYVPGRVISVTYGGTTSTATTNASGTANFVFTAGLSSGTYSYSGSFAGDTVYEPNAAQAFITINRRPIVMNARYISNIYWSWYTLAPIYPQVNVKDGYLATNIPNLPITFTLFNATFTATTDAAGNAAPYIAAISSAGFFATTSTFAGNATYLPLTIFGRTDIYRRETALSNDLVSTFADAPFTARATLKEAHPTLGTLLANRTVYFVFPNPGGELKSALTDASGVAEVVFNATSTIGNYQLRSYFTGDSAYNGCETTSTVSVGLRATALIPIPDTTTAGAGLPFSATVKLIDPNRSGGGIGGKTIYFSFMGSSGTAVTEAITGIASFMFTAPTVISTYTFFAEFRGDLTYNLCTATGIVAVEKNLTLVDGRDVPVTVQAGSVLNTRASLTLAANGLPVAGKTLYFVLDTTPPVTLSGMTDGTGIASVSFTAPWSTGTYNFRVSLPEDDQYQAASDTSNVVNVIRRYTAVTARDTSVYINDSFLMPAMLTDVLTSTGIGGKPLIYILHSGLPDPTTSLMTSALAADLGRSTATFESPSSSGTYAFSVTFPGDPVYDVASTTNAVIVSRRPTVTVGDAATTQAGAQFAVSARLSDVTPTLGAPVALSSQTLTFIFYTSSSSFTTIIGTTNASGVAVATFTAPGAAGSYYYDVFYYGTRVYSGSSDSSVLVTVTKLDTTLSADPVTTTVAAPFTARATLTKAVGGDKLADKLITFVFTSATTTFTLQGYTNDLGVSTVTFTAPLSVGAYNYTAVFAGDATYNGSSDLNNLVTVNVGSTTLSVPDGAAVVGQVFTSSVTLRTTMGGIPVPGKTITFTYDGSAIPGSAVTNDQGVAYVNFTPLSTGTYRLDAAFAGDGSYFAATGSGTITVMRRPTDLVVDNATVNVSQVFVATATLYNVIGATVPLAGQTVTFLIDGVSFVAVTDAQGVAHANYTAPAAPGLYAISVSYDGSAIYAPDTSSGTLTVNKYNTALTLTNVAVTALNVFTATATLRGADGLWVAGRTIDFLYQGVSLSAVTNAGGQATISYNAGPSSGPWRISAFFDGTSDMRYNSSTTTATVTVARRNLVMVLDNAAGPVMSAFVSSATFFDQAASTPVAGLPAANIRFSLLSSTIPASSASSSAGRAFAPFTVPTTSGTYRLSGWYLGDATYNPVALSTAVLTASRLASAVSVSSVQTKVELVFSATATLTAVNGSSGTAVVGRTVVFVFQSSTQTRVTDAYGIAVATFSAPSSSGTFMMQTRFDGDGTYAPAIQSTASVSVVTHESVMVSTGASAYCLGVFTASATLADVNGLPVVGRAVGITFSGLTTVGMTDAFGLVHATFTAPGSSGTVTAAAVFGGDYKYNYSSTTISVQVARRPSSVSAPSLSPRVFDVFTASATLLDAVNASTVAARTLTFTFSAQPFVSVTNAYGLAVATYTAPASSGTYPLSVVFAGDSVYLPSSAPVTVTALRRQTVIVVATAAVRALDVFTATATLSGSAAPFEAVSGRTLVFTYRGSSLPGVTNGAGLASVQFNALASSGTYPVTVAFADTDPSYAGTLAVGTVTVNRRPVTLGIADVTTRALDVFIATATLADAATSAPVAGRSVIHSFLAASSAAFTSAAGISSTTFTAPASATMTYQLSGVFAGDATYEPAAPASATVTVTRRPVSLGLAPSFAIINGTFTLTAGIRDGLTMALLNGKSVTLSFAAGSQAIASSLGSAAAVFTASVSSGVYASTAQFAGDDTYLAAAASASVTVDLRPVIVQFPAITATVNKVFTASATLIDVASGLPLPAGTTVRFEFQGSAFTVLSGASVAVATFTAAGPVGSYPLSVTYGGSTLYASTQGVTSISVQQRTTAMTVSSTTVRALEVFYSTATLRDAEDGITPLVGASVRFDFRVGASTLTFTAVTGAGGIAVSTFAAPAAAAAYQMTATFDGDASYQAATATSSITVIRRPSSVTVSSATAVIDGVFTATATLRDGLTLAVLSARQIDLSFSGASSSAVSGVSGEAFVHFTAPSSSGTFPLAGSFAGDATYLTSSGTASVLVVRRQVRIAVSTAATVIDAVFTASATVTDALDGTPVAGRTLSLSFQGVPAGAVTSSSGLASGIFTAPGSSGTFVLSATFSGDQRFDAASSSGQVVVGRRETLVSGDPVTTRVLNIFTATATLRDLLSGSVIAGAPVRLFFAGSTTTRVTDAAGIVVSTFTAPASSGSYSMALTYDGSARYGVSSSSVPVTVLRRLAQIIVDPASPYAMDVFIGTATLMDASAGTAIVGATVSFSFLASSGSSLTSVDGLAVRAFNAPASSGAYSLSASFGGSDLFDPVNSTGTVTVRQRAVTIQVSSATAFASTVFSATATLADAVSAGSISGRQVSFSIIGGTYSLNAVTGADGVATTRFSAPVSSGSLFIAAAFAGDATYAATGSSAVLNVLARPTALSSGAVSVPALDVFSTTATLRDILSGAVLPGRPVIFTFGVFSSTVTSGADGTASATFTAPADSGTYVIGQYFNGDASYAASSAACSVEVQQRPTHIQAANTTANSFENFTVRSTLFDTATSQTVAGRVLYFNFRGSVSSGTTNAVGIATATFLAPASPGNYFFDVEFRGDPTFAASISSAPVKVGVPSVLIASDVDTVTMSRFSARVSLFDNLSQPVLTSTTPVRFVFYGVAVSTAMVRMNATGSVSVDFFAPSSSGTFYYTADYEGDGIYSPSSATGTVTVRLRQTSLFAYNSTSLYGSSFTVRASLQDIVGEGSGAVGISSQTIQFSFAGSTVTAVTDAAGEALGSFFAALSSGTYPVTASYGGNISYAAASATASVTIDRRSLTVITYSVGDAVAGSSFTATVELRDIVTNLGVPGKEVAFTFGSSSGTVMTDAAGLARQVFFAPVSSGTYLYGADFTGDPNYAPASSTGTVTVSSRGTVLVAPAISVAGGSPVTIAASLIDLLTQGGVPGQSILFTFGGSSYTVVTDGVGRSTASFSAPASTGTYQFTVSFAGSGLYGASITTGSVTVGQELTSIDARDGLSVRIFDPVTVDAVLRSAIGLQLEGLPVRFVASTQTVSGVTNGVGRATGSFSTAGLVSTGPVRYEAYFDGTTQYVASSDTSSVITVLRRETLVLVPGIQTVTNRIFTASATLTDNVNGSSRSGTGIASKTLSFQFFNGASTITVPATTDALGIAHALFTAPAVSGTYVVGVAFADGDPHYLPSQSAATVQVLSDDGTGKATTMVKAFDVSTYLFQTFTASAVITASGLPVPARTMLFTYFDGISSFTRVALTDSAGLAVSTFTAPASTGSYRVTAGFAGDSLYGASSGISYIAVDFLPTAMTVNSITADAGAVFTATATLSYTLIPSSGLAGRSVIFEYYEGTGSVTTSVLTDAYGVAVATFQAAPTPGTGAIQARFAGDGIYAPASGSASVTRTPRNLQTILAAWPARTDIAEVFITSAVLTSAGVPISGKTVSFSFNGAAASAVTDQYGIAQVSFTAPLSTGTFPYGASFAGDAGYAAATTSSTVTVLLTVDLQDPKHIAVSYLNANATVQLDWTEVTFNRLKIKGYIVEKTVDPAGSWSNVFFTYSTSSVRTYAEPTVADRTVYYRVRTISWDDQTSPGLVVVSIPPGADKSDPGKTEHIYLSPNRAAWVSITSRVLDTLYANITSTTNLRLVVTPVVNPDFLATYDYHLVDDNGVIVDDFAGVRNRNGFTIVISYARVFSAAQLAASGSQQMVMYHYNGVEWIKIGGSNDVIARTCQSFSKKLGTYAIRLGSLATEFTLNRVAPRIFTPEEGSDIINKTRFYFENPENDEITIRIYDLTSALVRRNVDTESESIMYWDGRDMDGTIVRAGIYIYQIETRSRVINGTVVVAK